VGELTHGLLRSLEARLLADNESHESRSRESRSRESRSHESRSHESPRIPNPKSRIPPPV
jgi:hypothetical protein